MALLALYVRNDSTSIALITNYWTISLKTFWIPITLWLLRNGVSIYRQIRATYASNAANVRPTPPNVQLALNIIFASATIFLVSTFLPAPNIFRETQSRLQTPPDVLFNRLRNLRDLTPLDEALSEKLKSKESKLLYLAFGPYVVGNCPFCIPQEPTTYLTYALPAIIAPHLIHAAVLGVVTSKFLAGAKGARWRPHVTLAALALTAGEVYLTATYNVAENVKATRGNELDFFYERMKLYRCLAFVAVDCALAGVLWLSSTGRLFVGKVNLSQRLEDMFPGVIAAISRVQATASLAHTKNRQPYLQKRYNEYWKMEAQVRNDIEVLEAERKALARLDVHQVNSMAGRESEKIMTIIERARNETDPNRVNTTGSSAAQ